MDEPEAEAVDVPADERMPVGLVMVEIDGGDVGDVCAVDGTGC